MARGISLVVALLTATPVTGFAQQASPSVPIPSAESKPAQATGPVTIMFSVTVKEGRENEAAEMFQRLARTTHAEDDGVITYVFLQQQNSPREYVLYEQWRGSAAVNAHLARLRKVWGPPREGGSIPATILDLFETSRAVRYRVVE
jgi:quinol monooxygenase YgiN